MPNISEISGVITPILVAVVGMYLRSLLKKIDSIDELKAKVSELTINLSSLNNVKAEWVEMRIQITKLIVEMEHIKKSNEDVTVMKRDMTSLWKNIDRIKDALFDEEYSGGNQ